MKLDKLIYHCKTNDISMPFKGTGIGGRIVARDFENVLGDYFSKLKYNDTEELKHLSMRRQCQPMKAYRYTNLNDSVKQSIWDDTDWIGEEKFNGWRMIITYRPESGFRFWGGNISTTDFLPIDYTEHIFIGGRIPSHKLFKNWNTSPLIIDSEVVCNTSVEHLDGRWSTNTLDAVKAILGSGWERAREQQELGNKLEFHLFDMVTCRTIASLEVIFEIRRLILEVMKFNYIDNFHIVKQYSVDKKEHLHNLWRQGAEGMILKNKKAFYVPSSRKQDIAIKVKRTMSGELGEEIDAFIMGHILTSEHSKKGLIGGIKLGVWVGDKVHQIATVTNMPDTMRIQLTDPNKLELNPDYMYKVLVIDGQELSARNKMILHATVDWDRGYRKTKNYVDCTFDMGSLQEEKF